MSDKSDNELLEEILFHLKETRKSVISIKQMAVVVMIAVVLSAVGTMAIMG